MKKLKVLRCLKPIAADNITKQTVRGQYAAGEIEGKAVPGYLQEDEGGRENNTETFVALKAEIANWRWAARRFIFAQANA